MDDDMKNRFFALLAVCLTIPACSLSSGAPQGPASSSLSNKQKAAVGRKIWQNESAGKIDGLTAWNAGENFPSLGIGHFIWYPAGVSGNFHESWPDFISYARYQGAQPPAIALKRDCPWPNRAAFKAAFHGPEMTELRTWLSQTVSLQTDYIISRSQAALPKVLRVAPPYDRARLQANYEKVATTTNGTYALIDYVNFKGDGTDPNERYNGGGWGLLQVLAAMRDVPAGQPAAKEFADAAKRMLTRRVKNSPPERGEAKWLPGWHNRCDTYAKPL